MDPRRLGQVLVGEGLLSEEQVEQALAEFKQNGSSFVETIVNLKFIEEQAMLHFLSHQFGMETVDLGQQQPSPAARQSIPGDLAKRYRLVPIEFDKEKLTLAVINPGDVDADELRRAARLAAGIKLEIKVAPAAQVADAITKLYPGGASGRAPRGGGEISAVESKGGNISLADEATDEPEATLDADEIFAQLDDQLDMDGKDQSQEEYSVEAANEAPVKRMCNYIIAEAVKRRASDIHINPTARGLTVRFRIDGTLQNMPSPPSAMKRGVIARFKVMANMNITERRKPQDGRIKIRVHKKTIDLRVSVIPQVEGENIVMRILDQSSLQFDLGKLGFEPQELETYEHAIHAPFGMILHTGPTGSGKTTTLYSALSYIYDPAKAFITLEDPVEYEMPNIVQVQMDHEVGLDFSVALRSALRHDPNVMMVGEIRDKETATIAIQAALTGHLLFSTLHTNDAPSTITRLIDIGIEPAYVGTAIRLIVAQRLMKRVCSECKAPYTPTEADFKKMDVEPEQAEGGTFFKSTGCKTCDMSGYKGRIGIYEMLRNTTEIQELVYQRADALTLRKTAEGQGMRSLRGLAIQKWKMGMTTGEEVQRVTMGGD